MQTENHTFKDGALAVGQYLLHGQQLLGQGATGKVYRGEHSTNHQPVAIKHIDLNTINDDATRALLQNQMKALKMISHVNVLKLHDIVETPGNVYIVTELLEGGTLKQMLGKKGVLSEMEAMTLFRDILAGCRAVTDANIIHRDLKPGNIMLGGGVPKIIDFGFCEVIIGGGIVRAFNVGSPAYMAPQALLKTLYSEKSDSWSLGIILYEMLHGCTPDRGTDIRKYLEQVRTNPGLFESSIKGELSPQVRQILVKSLAYKVEDRMSISGMKYQTDVFMIQNKGKSTPASSALSSKPARTQLSSATHPFSTYQQVANIASGLRETMAGTAPDMSKPRVGSGFMQTQLPGKAMKQNRQCDQHFRPYYKQCVPTEPTERQQSINLANFFSQLSEGNTKVPQFTRASLLSNDQSRSSNISFNSSMKTAPLPVANRNQSSMIGVRRMLGQGGQWQKMSRLEGMQRPSGQPVYRQVTVRYL